MTEKISEKEDLVIIDYYTDPLCCWSWALEPELKKFLEVHSVNVKLNTIMGGLVPDWSQYNDPLNDVTKPAQMAPLWMEMSQITGMTIKTEIWHHDAPVSSYPACIAVKCMERQSHSLAEKYLYQLRKGVMMEGKNISRTQVLLDIASEMRDPSLHLSQFEEDLLTGEGIKAFQKDLEKKEKNNIHRLPALIMKIDGKGLMIFGYRPYPMLEEIYGHLLKNTSGINKPV
jgi:predicted DsbA family dithiol-disulfide isomerase